MENEPIIDGRQKGEILDRLREIAPYYVEEWDPSREDAGTVLFQIFADLTEDVITRLDQVPEMHQAAFLNSLDLETYPPQPATLPLSFTVDEAATENIQIPLGTTVVADATDERPKQKFETVGDRDFEATPASLTDCFAVDPGTDRIVDHQSLLADDARTQFFVGKNEQRHEYYLGHSELLTLNPGSSIELTIRSNAPDEIFRDYLNWEYYGENQQGEEGWHPITIEQQQEQAIATLSEVQQVEAFLENQESNLDQQGYQLRSGHPEFQTLARAIADDLRKDRLADRNKDFPLPENLFEDQDVDSGIRERLYRQTTALQNRLESTVFENQFSQEFDEQTLKSTIPGEILSTEVNGVESRWIRCRIPTDELASPLFEVFVESAHLSVGSSQTESGGGLPPDTIIADNVIASQEGSEPFYPLGKNPTQASMFYISCTEAFTKTGATVTLDFEAVSEEIPDGNNANPDLVWEYWNGNGWGRLSVEDSTDLLRRSGTVTFDVPADLNYTNVMGNERQWIRARLVSGNYGEIRVEQTEENNWEQVDDHIAPPEYETLTVQYSQSGHPFDHQLTYNSLTYTEVQAETEFKPFKAPDSEKQILYLGFDSPLRGGPIQLFLPIEGSNYPHEFTPWLDVEYCSDPLEDEWTRLSVRDNTADLTERGILMFTFPEETESFEMFGKDRHWVRIRVTEDEFDRSNSGLFTLKSEQRGVSSTHQRLSTESITERERKEQTRTPPALSTIHLNATWGENVTTVQNKTLGSSDESANQQFNFEQTPILEADLWVNEHESISKREKQRLENDGDVQIRKETDNRGELTAFWVKWASVPDFFNSDSSSRHFVLNRRDGTVSFGDGKTGAIPPSGQDNITASYKIGGGSDGNVKAGAVSKTEEKIRFIDDVTNPAPGENGEDQETLDEFVSRAPKQLRDRGVPVTKDGFERITLSAAREIAKVQCCAGKSETGEPGHVTLIVVPETSQRRPTPSDKLLDQVEEVMEERAPESIVADQSNFTVQGPRYAEVSIDATVQATGVESTTYVQETAESALTEFCHPLTGGLEGDGWEIGMAPEPNAFSACLERTENISRVTDLSVTYEEGGRKITLAGDEGEPEVSSEVLIYSGRHNVTVKRERR